MSIKERLEVLKSHHGCSNLSESDLLQSAYHTLVNQEFMSLYVSSTETYISLAIAALGLSVAFREKVLGKTGPLELSLLLLISWSLLGFTVASGAYYLYAAPKHIELRFQCSQFTPFEIWPGHVYGACTISLISGLFLLFVFIVRQAQRTG